MRSFSLGISLLALWLLLSGYFTPLMIGLGVASCVLVVLITRNMAVIDHEGHPVHLLRGILFYFPWLMWEIAKTNWAVGKIIVSRKMPIHPHMVRVKASQHNELGVTIYANSITLTPGTVTMSVIGEDLIIHCLTREAAEDLKTGEMDRRVTALED